MAALGRPSLDRVARARTAASATGFLSVPDITCLRPLGFEPVGDVLGAYVAISTPVQRAWGLCAARDTSGRFIDPPPVITTADARRRGPASSSRSPFVLVSTAPDLFAAHVAWLRRGWEVALERLLEECAAIGGDGVIGVVAQARRHDAQHRREFLLRGSALRARGAVRPARPFATTLGGADIASLATAGWFPAGIAIAVAAAMRHDDYGTIRAQRRLSGNGEVPGLSELLTGVRSALRAEAERRGRDLGADGLLWPTAVEVELQAHECDHVAEGTGLADAVVRVRELRPSAPTPVVPLS